MSDELIARLGPLPRTHGLLDAMLADPSPTAPPTSPRTPASAAGGRRPTPRCGRSSACRSCRRATSSAPSTSPTRRPAPEFTADDEAAVVLLASHAAIAIDQARLFEDSRELALSRSGAGSPASCTTP